MSAIDESEVRRVADLARLELDDEEVARLAEELGAIVDHFERLRELEPGDLAEPDDVSGPSGGRLRLRPDVPSPDPMAAGPERAAPDWRDGFFVVPRLAAMDRSDDGAP